MEDNCPSNDYKKGEPQGKCWGNGHYMCPTCIHYRHDFKLYGQEYIDWAYMRQGELHVVTI